MKILIVSNFYFSDATIIKQDLQERGILTKHAYFVTSLANLFQAAIEELPKKLQEKLFSSGPPEFSHLSIIHSENKEGIISNWMEASLEGNVLPQSEFILDSKVIEIGSSDEIIAKLLEEEFDTMVYLFGDEAFYVEDITGRIIHDFFRYLADFSFSDGLPLGFTPEIINRSSLIALDKLYKSALEERNQSAVRWRLFDVLQKDVNAFDVETILAKADFRIERLLANAENPVNYDTASKILKDRWTDGHYSSWNENEAIDYLKSHSEIKRSKTSYLQLQISERAAQLVSYLPNGSEAHQSLDTDSFMSLDRIRAVLKKIIPYNPQITISLSPWGEISYHPDVYAVISEVLGHKKVNLVFETSGLGWDLTKLKNFLENLDSQSKSRLNIIVLLDSIIPEEYQKIRGAGFQEVMSFIDTIEAVMKNQLYVQRTRLKEFETSMLDFYRYWKSRNIRCIVQKYEDFAGLLEQRKLVDLTPVHRNVCWKIRREMFVYLDGTVGLCKTDIKKTMILGNIFIDDVEDIWAKGEKWFKLHVKDNYPELCKVCDEYYIYNF